MTHIFRTPSIALLIVILVTAVAPPVKPSPRAAEGGASIPDVYPNLIVVKLRAGGFGKLVSATGNRSLDRLLAQERIATLARAFPKADGLASTQSGPLSGVYLARFSGPRSPNDVAKAVAASPLVAYAEPLYTHRLSDQPNDPRFSEQDYLTIIQAESAWDKVKGSSGNVVIAIIDGGTDIDHPDLAANIWLNTGEVANNGLDDDGNGFIDDVRGWNFSNDSNDPTATTDHGTLTAGLAGAVTDNSLGVAGASWNSIIMPVNAADPADDDLVKFGYEAIVYAVENGADVLNLSWGRRGPPSGFEQDIIEFAHDQGVAIVASAGNDGAFANNFYPASYPNVLSVSATTAQDSKAGFANYGDYIDLAAPGVGLLSTINGGGFGPLTSGTSFSAPLVSGIVALVKTQHPDWLGIQAAEQVRVSADDIDSQLGGFAGLLGRGRLNANRAVTITSPSVRSVGMEVVDSDRDGVIQAGESILVTITFINYLASVSGVKFTLTPNTPLVTWIDELPTYSVETLGELDVPFELSVSPSAPPGLEVRFTIALAAEGYSDREQFSLVVEPPFRDISINNISTSITNIGRIGFADVSNQKRGSGFSYKGSPNLIYEGAIMAGLGPNAVLNSARSGLRNGGFFFDQDFGPASETTFRVDTPGALTEQESSAIMDDDRSSRSKGLRITQETLAESSTPNEDFVLLRYTLDNRGEEALQNLHFGLFLDWDIAATPGGVLSNSSDFTLEQKLGFVSSGSFFVGSALLSDQNLSFRAIDAASLEFNLNDGFSQAEKWQALSGGIHAPRIDDKDVAQVIAAGPLSLAPGEIVEVGFALIGGDSVPDLQTNAQAAQALWDALFPTSVAETALSAIPRKLTLGQNFPNPFNPSTEIRYEISEPGMVELSIFNLLGQRTVTLVQTELTPGRYTATWNGRDISGVQVASGVYVYVLRSADVTLSRKFLLLR